MEKIRSPASQQDAHGKDQKKCADCLQKFIDAFPFDGKEQFPDKNTHTHYDNNVHSPSPFHCPFRPLSKEYHKTTGLKRKIILR